MHITSDLQKSVFMAWLYEGSQREAVEPGWRSVGASVMLLYANSMTHF